MGLQKCALNLNYACKELQPHGSPEFPCAGYSKLYTKSPEDLIPWHWHDEIEIVFVKTGKLKLQIPGKTFRLGSGEGAVINSNILHFAAAEPACQLQSLVFHASLVAGREDSVYAKKYIVPLIKSASFDGCTSEKMSFGKEPLFARCFLAAFEALASDTPGYEFIVRENLTAICFELYKNYEQDLEEGEVRMEQNSVRIRKMMDYIHNHFSENLELSQIARAADIGERECLRCFQKGIQVSPVQYLLKYRISQGALSLLQNPGSSVADVSIQCGFNSPSNFSQMFRRYYGCTPKEYRKRNQK